MARAAFLMDRLMSKVGLHGKSFIPMLSSFACAIPGIMATRTIETPKDRLVTILVAPLMSCSARLPVYTLLIGACITGGWIKPDHALHVFAGHCRGAGDGVAFQKNLLRGETPMLVMELPPYRSPCSTSCCVTCGTARELFLRRAGTVILGINILLWFLASYPSHPEIRQDFAAQRAAVMAGFAKRRCRPADQSTGPRIAAIGRRRRQRPDARQLCRTRRPLAGAGHRPARF